MQDDMHPNRPPAKIIGPGSFVQLPTIIAVSCGLTPSTFPVNEVTNEDQD